MNDAWKKPCLVCGRNVIWATRRISGKRVAVDPANDRAGGLVLIPSGRPDGPLYVEDFDPAKHGRKTKVYGAHERTCDKANRVKLPQVLGSNGGPST